MSIDGSYDCVTKSPMGDQKSVFTVKSDGSTFTGENAGQMGSLEVEDGKVDAVLSNAQTGGAETDRVEQAAKDAGIPVVGFTELLAPDQSYAEWMRAAITDLAAALDK